MMTRFKIQSIIIAPDAWLFTATSEKSISDDLEFTSPQEHGVFEHTVTYESDASNLKDAWSEFYKKTEAFMRAAVFYTSSYMAFHNWRHVILDREQNVVLISIYSRTPGTGLGIYTDEEKDNVNKLITLAQQDERLKKFLHNYKMAVLTDSPETQNAYEKYLILAAESLAGKVTDDGVVKLDRKRLKQIIGEELHDYFFQHVDSETGNNIRNLHMHDGESPNSKPAETIKLIEKFKTFIKNEYDIQHMHEIEVQFSPTRGLYRDDGGLVFARPLNDATGIEDIDIKDWNDSDAIFNTLIDKGYEILNLGSGDGKKIYANMIGI